MTVRQGAAIEKRVTRRFGSPRPQGEAVRHCRVEAGQRPADEHASKMTCLQSEQGAVGPLLIARDYVNWSDRDSMRIGACTPRRTRDIAVFDFKGETSSGPSIGGQEQLRGSPIVEEHPLIDVAISCRTEIWRPLIWIAIVYEVQVICISISLGIIWLGLYDTADGHDCDCHETCDHCSPTHQ